VRFCFLTTRNYFWRCFIVLAIVLVLVIVAAGSLLAANYKHFGNLFKVVSLVNERYLEPVNATNLVDGAIRGVVDSLGDPYSVYLDPKVFAQLEEQISGTFGGLGILVTNKDGLLTVAKTYPGTPAEKFGISEGDIIIKINGENTSGWDLETAVGLMRGPVGSKIKLTLSRKDNPAPRDVEIPREQISIPTVEGYMIKNTNIGYLALSQFTTKTPGEVDDALAQLQKQGLQGLLLDLRERDITGKDLETALDKAGITVNKNTIPFETRSPFVTSGIRVGTPAVTTRGFGPGQMRQLADWMDQVASKPDDEKTLKRVREEVRELCREFPLYGEYEL